MYSRYSNTPRRYPWGVRLGVILLVAGTRWAISELAGCGSYGHCGASAQSLSQRIDAMPYARAPRVAVWRDKSGAGNDLIAGSSSLQPNLHENALGGHPAIAFVKTGQGLHTVHPFGEAGDADRTLITVQRLLVVNTGTTAFKEAFGIDLIAARNIYRLPYHYTNDNTVAQESDEMAQWRINTAIHHRSVSTGFVNGERAGSDLPAVIETLPAPMTVGTRIPGDGLFRAGEIAEILYYNRALTAQEQARVESYLAARWHISNAPVRETPPETFEPSNIPGLTGWYDTADETSLTLAPARS